MSSLVSIIVPTFNHEKYVYENLSSILSQDYKNYQVIIVNDGSIDSTANVIKEFIAEKNCQDWVFIDRKENKGLIFSLKEAFSYVQGEYISLVASDDFWADSKLSEQVNVLEQNEDINLVFTDYYDVNEKSQIIRLNCARKRFIEFDDVLHGVSLPPASLMFRKNSFIDDFDAISDLIVEDLFIWLSCLQEEGKKAYIISKPLVFYRYHESNTTSKFRIRVLDDHYRIVSYFEKKKSNKNGCPYWALRNFDQLSRRQKKEAFFYMKKCLALFYSPRCCKI